MASVRVPIISKYEYQKAVIDKDLSNPPSSPNKGDRYLVGSTPSGDWTNKENQIAEYNNGWEFTSIFSGMMLYVKDENRLYQYTDKWEDLAYLHTRKRIVVSKNTGGALNIAETGKTITCNNSSDQSFPLPSVGPDDVGSWFRFVKLGSGKLTIVAADSDRIADSGPGGTIYNDSTSETYATITILLASENMWVIESGHGTWTTTT